MKRKSTVRFWISQILQNVGMIGVVALILEVFALVGSAGEIEGGYIWFFLSMLPMYIVLAAAFWVFIYILGFFKTYYPVVLSFRAHRGKTHRNFIFCLLTIDALMFVILAAVFAALFHMQVMDALLACSLITGVMLFFEGIGLAFSVLYVRYGKLGVAICALVGAAFGGVFGAEEHHGRPQRRHKPGEPAPHSRPEEGLHCFVVEHRTGPFVRHPQPATR